MILELWCACARYDGVYTICRSTYSVTSCTSRPKCMCVYLSIDLKRITDDRLRTHIQNADPVARICFAYTTFAVKTTQRLFNKCLFLLQEVNASQIEQHLLKHTMTHTNSLSRSVSLTHSYRLSLTHTLTHPHTQTRTDTHAHTHTPAHVCVSVFVCVCVFASV